MDNPPKLDPRLLEAIEACRPGSEDLSNAELAALADGMASDPQLRTVYDKLKQTDVVLGEAFHDVPVPDGLANRIVDRLASARQTLVPPVDPAATEASAAELPSAVAKCGGLLPRRWALGAGGLAVAGSVLAAFVIWGGSEEPLTGGSVERAAVELFDEEGNPPPGGTAIVAKWRHQSCSISPAIIQPPNARWRPVAFLGRRGVAYDLTAPGRPRATLYVIKRAVPNLGVFPPFRPPFNSQNRCAAAWQSDDLLYVLVVDGPEETYRGVLSTSRGTWT